MQLRPYQREAVDAVYSYWRNGGGNGIIVVPTGGGKSLIQATLIREIQENWSARILCLTHVKELIGQNHDELIDIWPEAPAGIYSAGLKRRDIHSEVLFAGIQSIDKHVHKLDPPPEIIIIDEAHMTPNADNTRYRRTLTTLKAMYPYLKVVGLTATPFRLDGGYLTEHENAIFNDIIYDVDVLHLIDNGWLAPVKSKGSAVKIDTAGVKTVAGDYDKKVIAQRAIDATPQAVLDIQRQADDRKKWLIFASGVEHANQIQEYLQVPSAVVTGATDGQSRDEIVAQFKRGEIRALVNVGVFTTGFNVRDVDCIVLLRATKSTSLYIQMIGRGMRTYPGKADCLVLDYGGNVERHGPIDRPEVSRPKGDGEGIAPAKECPECFSIIFAGLRECPDCGYVFPQAEKPIAAKASVKAVLSVDIKPEVFKVQNTEYRLHKKPGKPDSVRIDFYCGIQRISKWVSPENKKARYFYHLWCSQMKLKQPYPETALDFIAQVTAQAVEIEARKTGKYWEVTHATFVHSV